MSKNNIHGSFEPDDALLQQTFSPRSIVTPAAPVVGLCGPSNDAVEKTAAPEDGQQPAEHQQQRRLTTDLDEEELQDVILSHLHDAKRIVYQQELLQSLQDRDISAQKVTGALKMLASNGTLVSTRVGRRKAFWSSRYEFVPSPLLTRQLYGFDVSVVEGAALRAARRRLPGLLPMRRFELANARLRHIPLLRAEMPVTCKRGFLRRTVVTETALIFLDGRDGSVLMERKGNKLRFHRVVEAPAHKLPPICPGKPPRLLLPGESSADFSVLNPVMPLSRVPHLLNEKFGVSPASIPESSITLCLLPYWEFRFTPRDDSEEPVTILIDAVYGERLLPAL